MGAGRVGAWVARMLKEDGWDVLATTRNDDTAHSLRILGVEVLPWTWEPGQSWKDLVAFQADVWCITVPPWRNVDRTNAFHLDLASQASKAGVSRLVWTSSTSVYDPEKSGVVVEQDAQYRPSKHTGIDMLAIEQIHRNASGDGQFVAIRLGGLFGEGAHPARPYMHAQTVEEADRVVPWVHLRDAALACVLAAKTDDELPEALNVVAPHGASRRDIVKHVFRDSKDRPVCKSGGVDRVISTQAIHELGMQWRVPDVMQWMQSQPGVVSVGSWEGPFGRLHWTKHASQGPRRHGVAIMVHGYKGFRNWGQWGAIAEAWAHEGWDVFRMDFSHNGHCPPFSEDCLDEGAWSDNRYHMEVEEVAYALGTCADSSVQKIVMGHSRGGAMAVAGAQLFERRGGSLAGVVGWASVSDVFARFPSGDALEEWKATDRLEVVNGRTGQIMVHPFAFWQEAQDHKGLIHVEQCAQALQAPVLILHGDADMAVPWMEGKAISSWSRRGTFVLIEGADHVFGMSHAEMATHWPRHLVQAWNAQREWIHTQVAESI